MTKAELIEALNGLSPDCQLQFWPFPGNRNGTAIRIAVKQEAEPSYNMPAVACLEILV